MYRKVKATHFENGCSSFAQTLILKTKDAVANNLLAALDVDSVNLLHFQVQSGSSKVNFVTSDQIKMAPLSDCLAVAQFSVIEAQFLHFDAITLFLLLSTHGIHVYNEQLNQCMFSCSLRVLCAQLQLPFGQLSLAGIACLRNLMFIGCSNGQVLVFELHFGDSSNLDINVLLRERLSEHQQPITNIHSLVDHIQDSHGESNQIHRLTVADAFGNVSVWHLDGAQLNLIVTFKGFNNFPCVSARFYQDVLITAYTSGHLRVYNLIDKSLVCEVSAHARSVSSLDIAQDSGLLLSTSEDTFVRVWQLKPSESKSIAHLFCQNVPDHLLTSALFLDSKGHHFAAIAYDQTDLILFERTND